jgi:signal transduction histidine kinase
VTAPRPYGIVRSVTPDLRAWWPDLLLGVGVAFLGVVDLTSQFDGWSSVSGSAWLVTLGCAISAALFRRAPGGSLLAYWLAGAVMVASSTPLVSVQLIVVLVGFGTARYGSPLVVWLSGLSIPAGALVAVLTFERDGYPMVARIDDPLRSLYTGDQIGTITLLLIGVIVFAVPWLLGLLVRSLAATEKSQQHREAAEALQHDAEARLAQASEIADLRAAQARMANDVHDVVGHSLAVILAQAESAQFLEDDQIERIRETLRNVAVSARQSLQDVRAVLSSTETDGVTGSAGLDSLVEGLTAAGNDVRSTVFGAPRPLPPELDVVAFRVLQEMLTNALRHGQRGRPVHVERHWEGELRIEVRNGVDPTVPVAPVGGLGVDGMRRRLESVGGRLDVRRRDDADGSTFSATAWIPLRTVSA